MPKAAASAVSSPTLPLSSNVSSSSFIPVTIEVPANHRLLKLKEEIAWSEMEKVTAEHWKKAGKNVDGGRGRPFDVAFHTRVIVLMLLLRLQGRKLERELKENAVARLFVEVDSPKETLTRDHSNLERTYQALGVDGMEALGALLLNKAQELGFAGIDLLSSDTTAQELPIGYPNEPGIFRQAAQRIGRLFVRLKKAGVEILEAASAPVVEILKLVKEHHLFAKSKEEKTKILETIVEQSQQLADVAEAVGYGIAEGAGSLLRSAASKLGQLSSFIKRLIPQVQSWMQTAKVAKDKLLHPGFEQARALLRNKAGKKCEFGFKWLLCKLGGGYVFGEMFPKPPAESSMPIRAVKLYRKVFGDKQTPTAVTYDRGGHAKKTIETLRRMGVQKIGIQPKGQASWLVEGQDRDMVRSERGKMEGIIGTLKSGFYGFNKPKQRTTQSLALSGHTSLVSFNLNKLLRDLVKFA